MAGTDISEGMFFEQKTCGVCMLYLEKITLQPVSRTSENRKLREYTKLMH